MLTIFGWNFKILAAQKYVNLVDLVKRFPTGVYYFFAKIGVDTAENEPLKTLDVIQFIYSFASLYTEELFLEQDV